MNLWYTDNPLSCMVMSAIAEGNPSAVARHIKDFKKVIDNPSAGDVFYGILRGCGTAMRICNWIGANYYYIDNGYFEAEYVNQSMLKNMDGKFRVVKNDMIELYQGPRPMYEADVKRICLLVPPSPYTANFYDTTPEDFVQETAQHLFRHGVSVIVRDKSSESPLEDQLGQCGFVVSFNSMISMEAIKRDIPAYDARGIFRNIYDIFQNDFRPHLTTTYHELQKFYEPKQFTLEQFRNGEWKR